MESITNTQRDQQDGDHEELTQAEIDRRKKFEQLYHDIRTKQENGKTPSFEHIDGEDNIDVVKSSILKDQIDHDTEEPDADL